MPRPFQLASSLGLLAIFGCAHPSSETRPGHGLHHRFDDPEVWAARFEDPARDAWQKPNEVLAALALPEDARAADLGAATGYFAVRLARAMPRGRVYAIDVEEKMVAYLDERARRESLGNLVGVLAAADDPKLPEAVDLVLVVDTYHHLDDRVGYFGKLKAKLTRGGRVAIIDFRRGQPMGPPDEHKVPAEQVKQELVAAGYRLLAEHAFLPNQHFLVFTPK